MLSELDAAREQLAAAERARDLAFDALENLQARLERVNALCDMAEWANRVDQVDGPPAVRVDELRRALSD